jgi:predicted acylesterase/phospholipase RssA
MPARTLPALFLSAGLAGAQAPPGTPAFRCELTPAANSLDYHPVALAPGQRPLVLALGGGGAKGIAHAGVLQRLQEEGIPVAGIAGTSAGAFVGALYATQYSGFGIERLLETYDLGTLMLDRDRRLPGETLREQEEEEISWLHFLLDSRQGLTFAPGGASGRNLNRILQLILARTGGQPYSSFDRLRVPFRAVTTDLQTGRAFVPAKGDLPLAIRASMSVPGILSPVLWEGDQLVDGMLVQNLPVETARSLEPRAAVLAVEVGQGLDKAYRTSVLGLASRALDVSLEERTEISRRSADLLLRPRTDTIDWLDFHRHVRDAVQEGRKAFDQHLDALEDLLYGPWAAQPAPGGVPVVNGPAPLLDRVQALASASLPDGPRQNRHYLRWLRRIEAEGLARRVDLRFTGAGPVLTLDPFPEIRRVEVSAPEAMRELLGQFLEQYRVRAGARYNPVNLGCCLDDFLLKLALQGRPWVKVEKAGFDPDRQVLLLDVREAWPRRLVVQGNGLPQAQVAGLRSMIQPFEDKPEDAAAVVETLMLAEKRLGLESIQFAPLPAEPAGSAFQVVPVPDRRTTLEGQLAFESTWDAHVVLGLHRERMFGTAWSSGLRAGSDRLQDSAAWETSRVSNSWPRLGYRIIAAESVYRFLPESLRTPYLPAGFQISLVHRSLRDQSLALELSNRFGTEDRGMVAIVGSREWTDLQPQPQGEPLPAATRIQAMGEWDDLDRGLFPTRGTVIRTKAGAGRLDRTDFWSGRNAFQFAYGQFAHYWPLTGWASLEGELETGLGWHLPFSQWYCAGGPSFLAGTPSGVFRVPGFAMSRVGLPIGVVRTFGANLQFVPRFDVGHMAAVEPGELTGTPQIRGVSVSLRGELWRWYCEVNAGRWHTATPGTRESAQLNLLVGTRPFNLWRRP